MAITKILARKGRLDIGINYALNGDKTEERVLTAHLNCDPGRECRQMLDTKRAVGKEGGVQYYHIIQTFTPGEITPELALEVAKEFAQEHLAALPAWVAVQVGGEDALLSLVSIEGVIDANVQTAFPRQYFCDSHSSSYSTKRR